MKKILFIFIIGTLFYSCDKTDCPNEQGCVEPKTPVDTNCTGYLGIDTCLLSGPITIHTGGDLNSSFRKMVIEEYTGYKCTNCPDGARKIDELKNSYKDTLIAISIHAGSFAKPKPEDGYVTDFRTSAGDAYNDEFLGPGAGYPNSVINRTKYDGSSYSPPLALWNYQLRTFIDFSSLTPPSILLTSYLSVDANTVLVKAEVKFNEATTNKHRLIFLCLEDDIVDVQLDGGTFLTDYAHKHVLRGAMELSGGETINDLEVAVGDIKTAESSYFALDPSWQTDKIEIVALLIDSDSKEIVQAELVHIN